MKSETSVDVDRASVQRLLREGCAELARLQRIRGAHRRTARRIARARLQVVLAASLLGMPLAGRAWAAEPRFVPPPAAAFRFPDLGSQSTPSFADIDGDGDLDAFLGDRYGETFLLENTGTADAPVFATALSNPYGLDDVGYESAPTFADIDGDGDLDAFVGEYRGVTFFFENVGTASAPAFLPPLELADVGYESAPTFADLDGDGDLDGFVGGRYGDVFFFQNTGTASAPAFAPPVTNPFGLADVGHQAAPTFADLDGDGDLDAAIGNTAGETVFFQNDGTAITPAFAAPLTNPFGLEDVGSRSRPTFADLDGDGDLDAAIGADDGETFFYQNTGTPSAPEFAPPLTNPFGLGDVGERARPAFADLDGDGDLDVFVGEAEGDTVLFENTGTFGAPAFAAPVRNPFGLTDVGDFSAPSFADLDGDGDLDAFLGTGSGNTSFSENTGTASAPAFAAAVTNPFGLGGAGGAESTPTFADLDGDGDLDALMGRRVAGTAFFENTGTATAPTFAAVVSNPFGLADVSDSSAPRFADLDGDLDLDGFIGTSSGNISFFRNTGTAVAPAFETPVTNPFGLADVGSFSGPEFADLDGDGDLDAFLGNSGGDTLFFENVASSGLEAEVAPKLKLNFRKDLKDSIQLKLTRWVLPEDFVAAGAELSVNVGGSVLAGTLDPKGGFKSDDRRDKLKLEQRKKDGTWTLRVKRKKGDFAAALLDEGLRDEDNAKPGKPVRVAVSIEAGGATYSRVVELSYRSKLGKAGTAK